MTIDFQNATVAGGGAAANPGGGGGLGNRVNAVMLATVLPAMEAAVRELLSAEGLGRRFNALT